MLRMQCE